MSDKLLPYSRDRFTAPAGDNAIVVYLHSVDGTPISPDSVGTMAQHDFVRLLVRMGHVPTGYQILEPDGRTVDEGDGFVRAYSRALQTLGILRFKSSLGREVFAQQTTGSEVGGGNYIGRFDVEKDRFVEYLYYAETHHDHLQINGFVEHWVATAGQ